MQRQLIVSIALLCATVSATTSSAQSALDPVVASLRDIRAARGSNAKIQSRLLPPRTAGPLAGGLVAAPPPLAADGRLHVYLDCSPLGATELLKLQQAGVRIERIPLRHVQHDGTGLEQYQPVLLVRGHLPEWLKVTIALGRLILWPDQPLLVRQGGLFERPTHAEVTYQATGKRRYPAKRTHSDHERLVLTPTSAHADCAEWAGACSRGCPRCR